MELPEIVSEEEWLSAHEALLAKEKEATRERDALAAERRRQSMMEVSTEYRFDGPGGEVGLLDLFEGHPQLILYHFWHPPAGDPCGGCSMFTDQVSNLAHLNARDTTFALVSTAPQPQIEAFKRRMGWSIPWYTTIGADFQEMRGTTEYFSLDVYLRDGDRAFLTYETRSRGVEALGSVWTFLDLTPLGRQEEWEERPRAARRRRPTNGGAGMTNTGRPRRSRLLPHPSVVNVASAAHALSPKTLRVSWRPSMRRSISSGVV